jgi:uncharacterized protein YjiS (DUF1127 family)
MIESKRSRIGLDKRGGRPAPVRLPRSRGHGAAAPVVISPRESRLRHVAAIVDATSRRRPAVSGPMRRWWSPISDWLVVLLDRVALWQERSKSRHLLVTMDDHTLRDIGVDRATARHLGGLPFWRE